MKSNNSKSRALDVFGSGKPKKGVAASKAAAPVVQVGAHGRYQIKSGRLDGAFIARAFPKPPVRTRGVIAEATGATEEAAIAALHEALDRRETSRTSGRRVDAQTGLPVPSAAEYAEAIGQVKLSDTQRTLLSALLLADEAGMTDKRMARAAGFKSLTSARKSLAGVGALFAEFLDIGADADEGAVQPEPTALVGYRGPAGDGEADAAPWILHAELREAIGGLRL
jgi:hypothetical protein